MSNETSQKLADIQNISDPITRRKEEFKIAIAAKDSGEFSTVRDALSAFARGNRVNPTPYGGCP